MRAGFLFKQLIIWLIIITFLAVCAVAVFFRYYAVKVALEVEFHFLVSEEKSVEAGAEMMKLEGGAGYILRYNNKDYAVLSVYLSQEDAQSVQEVLSLQNRRADLICLSTKTLCFRGKTLRKKVDLYMGALRTFYSCLIVLEENITRLEKGLTQEKSKGSLTGLKRQLYYMSEVYADAYPDFSSLCGKMERQLQIECGGVVYASRLRYILCEAVDGYLDLTEKFA